MGKLSGFLSLFTEQNRVKADSDEQEQGIVSDEVEEMDLDMDDEDLIVLKNQWLKDAEPYLKKIRTKQDENEKYWIGEQYPDELLNGEDRPLQENRIFLSLETLLPIATSKNPEPLVSSDETEESDKVADIVKAHLAYQADQQRLKLKIKQATRFWSLYFLGVAKVSWDEENDDIRTDIIRPQKLILDPTATIDVCEYTGYYIGEYRKDKASDLVKMFPKKAEIIKKLVDDKMGTSVQYIEWWTDDYVFFTLNNEVLLKKKNPHFNYEDEQEQQYSTDDYGNQVPIPLPKVKNHFKNPKKPYIFLSVFNLGKQPHDETTLVTQVLPQQDLINKRLRQIDTNADTANGCWIGAGTYMSKEQLSQITGAPNERIWIEGATDVNSALKRETGRDLPNMVYQNLIDIRMSFDNVFGTHGESRGESSKSETLGGRMIMREADRGRIGGGITEFIEQFADGIFNYWTQMFYVYYDEAHDAIVIGKERATEHASLISKEMPSKLLVSVKEGSLIPKDDLTQRNEVLDLWKMKAIDPITLFDKLGFPNPREAAEKLITFSLDPVALLAPKNTPVPEMIPEPQMIPNEGVLPPSPIMQ